MNECPDWLVAPVTQSLATREYIRSALCTPSFSQPYPVRRVRARARMRACVRVDCVRVVRVVSVIVVSVPGGSLTSVYQ